MNADIKKSLKRALAKHAEDAGKNVTDIEDRELVNVPLSVAQINLLMRVTAFEGLRKKITPDMASESDLHPEH